MYTTGMGVGRGNLNGENFTIFCHSELLHSSAGVACPKIADENFGAATKEVKLFHFPKVGKKTMFEGK